MNQFLSMFNACSSKEEAQSLYRKLALENHPDRGGDLRTMQEVNAAWAYYLAHAAKEEQYKRQREAHCEGRKSAADYHNMENLAEELRVRIEWALNNLPGVEVELIGLWIWLTGNTYAHKETIKASGYGFEYSGAKKAWYYASIPSFSKHRMKLDDIRALHGSVKFSRQNEEDQQQPRQPAAVPATV
jgi:hypothetical protein